MKKYAQKFPIGTLVLVMDSINLKGETGVVLGHSSVTRMRIRRDVIEVFMKNQVTLVSPEKCRSLSRPYVKHAF